MSKPAVVSLTGEEEQILREWTRAGTSEHRLVERAKVILLLHQGVANLEIARQLNTRPARVSKWRQRFAKHRLDGLRDADRKGRPSVYNEATDKRVLALLDEPPPKGYGTWSGPLLAEALGDVSDDQIWRILRKYGIYLERRRSWCISTDPEFGPKAADIVGLYLNPPQNALVVCVDEKPLDPGIGACARLAAATEWQGGERLQPRLQKAWNHHPVCSFRYRNRSGPGWALQPEAAARVPGLHE
jgi:transposase